MDSSKVTVKLLIDKKKQRVLYAEAGKDFTDFLISLLVLPLGTVMRLLGTDNGIANINKSVLELKDDYIQSNCNKDDILKPNTPHRFLSPKVPLLPAEAFSSNSSSLVLYKCSNPPCSARYTTSPGRCISCNWTMSAVDSGSVLEFIVGGPKGEGFVKEAVTFIVMDDLAFSPMSKISNITFLKKLNITDLGTVEEKVVGIGIDQGLQLLKHSLTSKSVLTDVFLRDGAVLHEVKDEAVHVKDENPKKRSKSYGA